MSNVTWLPRRALPDDPMEALKEVVAEYGAAGNQERNYGSNRFAHLFWCYLTDLMPLLEQRHADADAQRRLVIAALVAEADKYPLPPPRLRVVD